MAKKVHDFDMLKILFSFVKRKLWQSEKQYLYQTLQPFTPISATWAFETLFSQDCPTLTQISSIGYEPIPFIFHVSFLSNQETFPQNHRPRNAV